MKPAQIAVVGIALVAAVGAGFMAFNLTTPEPQEPVIITAEPAEPPIKLKEVLSTNRSLAMGESTDGALTWQKWPEDGISDTLITRDAQPDAIEKLKGTIARQAFFAGEPIREAKLIKPNEGFLSAMLPSGKRAVAIQIAADTAAGGFILPDDHVDVIMTRKKQTPDGDVKLSTETVLRNLRVLAIDQTFQGTGDEKTVIGSTATLEVDPSQAEALTAAQQIADRLVLSLRSLADSVPGSPGYAAFLLAQENAKRGKVKVVRYGKSTEITTNE